MGEIKMGNWTEKNSTVSICSSNLCSSLYPLLHEFRSRYGAIISNIPSPSYELIMKLTTGLKRLIDPFYRREQVNILINYLQNPPFRKSFVLVYSSIGMKRLLMTIETDRGVVRMNRGSLSNKKKKGFVRYRRTYRGRNGRQTNLYG